MSSLDNLWREYKETDSKIAKDKLLVEYAHLVKYIVNRLAVNLPNSVDRNDLTSSGIMGLIKADEKHLSRKEVSNLKLMPGTRSGALF